MSVREEESEAWCPRFELISLQENQMVPITLRLRQTPDHIESYEFDIHAYRDASALYNYLSKHAFGLGNGMTTEMEFGALSGSYPSVNSLPGQIIHHHADADATISRAPIAGEFRLTHQGHLYLIVLQWRIRDAPTKWQWFVPASTAWEVFRENVHEIFAHAILLAHFGLNGEAIGHQPHPIETPSIPLKYLVFGSPLYRENTIVLRLADGSDLLYEQIWRIIFGPLRRDFLPVGFTAAAGGRTQMFPHQAGEHIPFQSVVNGVGFLIKTVPLVGVLGINKDNQLLLLVVNWFSVRDVCWNWYIPGLQTWQVFLNQVGRLQAYGVLLAQL